MKSLRIIFCIFAVTLIGSAYAIAETGLVTGTVFDEETGQELIGANIWLVGTNMGAASGLEGKFKLAGIPPGTYDMKISYMGYGAKTVTGVVVDPEDPLTLNISLLPEAIEMPEIVVSAERILSSDVAVLADRKKAATIRDGISSEQISKSPDGTSGDALKRVTGLSIMDSKYVFIRGTTDRYNQTMLNEVAVTSTDVKVDKKSFAFDLIPANLLQNTVVVKTATPDLPGSFSGGLVQVNTLDFPTNRSIHISHSSSYDPAVWGKTTLRARGGDTDWLGIDDGTRELPDVETPNGNLDPVAKALPNSWEPGSKNTPLNRSYSVSYGDNFLVGGRDLGVLAALSYKNTYDVENFKYDSYEPENKFTGEHYSYEVLWGAILNTSFKPSDLHKFSLESSYNQAAEENIIQSRGMDMHWTPKHRQSIEWDERSLLVGKLTGDHNLNFAGGLELKWKAFTSRSESRKPDMKAIDYQYQGRDRETGEIIWGMCENYRIWSDLEERNTGFEADVTYPLGNSKIKVGVHSSLRTRDFRVDAFYTDHKNQQELTQLPIDEIFDPENYGQDKFRFKSYGPFSGQYDAEEHVDAYYGMLDLPFGVAGQRFRFVGGTRMERSDINIDGKTGQAIEDFTSGIVKTDWLPSANLTYMLNDNANLRMAYSHSVNRPEFRELADVLYYDYHELQNVRGNPDLKRAMIRNYDIRFEFFPRVGEVLAGSYFYKDFEDAIEIRLLSNPERAVRTWFNSPNGRNQGWEVEARKSFDYSYDRAGVFFPLPWTTAYYLLGSESGRVTLTANYTRIDSEMEYRKKDTSVWPHKVTIATRPLQGQSPWMTNVSMTFEDQELGSSFSVLYNSIGRRLYAVGDSRDEDIYEEPRDVLDLAVTQGLAGGLEFKVTAKDILSEDQVFTMGEGRSYRKVSKSATYSFSLAYKM